MRYTIRRPSLGAVCAAFFILWLGCAPLCAQEPLSDLQQQFAAERDEMIRKHEGRVEFTDLKALAERHAKILSDWLTAHADRADAIDARLMLTNIRMDIDEVELARSTLGALDPARASGLQLAAAAEMAQVLGMADQREAWIDAAVQKEAPLEDRMALAMFLMTRLLEVEKGESIFTLATEAAHDDEEQAQIAFYRATAIRMREDLPDGAYEHALGELVAAHPDTYWGSIARDQLAALALEIGAPAIPIAGPTLDGGRTSLSDLRGQVVLLDFWNAASVRDPRVPAVLNQLRTEFGERGLTILGVNLDTDLELARTAAKDRGMDWTQLGDGRGWKSDAALRYAIESVPYQILIDAEGNVAALRVFLLDDYGVKELRTAVEAEIAKRDG